MVLVAAQNHSKIVHNVFMACDDRKSKCIFIFYAILIMHLQRLFFCKLYTLYLYAQRTRWCLC